MGVREALAMLDVPTFPQPGTAVGTEKAQQTQGFSQCSQRSHGISRGTGAECTTHPCSACGRFAFPRPAVCYWCRGAAPFGRSV
jgi:hypothetical protein